MSEQKVCPFRLIVAMPREPEKATDYFGCLEDKCAMWRIPLQKSHEGTLESGPGYCGLAGKP
jgi:hypothetical protein